MIDLSYLTEEEQEMIMAVLKRDAELKKAEEERIKRLQKNERDKSKLKYLTGEWFYETKSQRHRDRIHGSDIIRASMKQRKAVTLLELTKLWAEKPSFVNSANQDVFVPAELSGLIEEPLAQPKERRENSSLPSGIHQEEVTTAVQSSAKRRQNPFNSSLMESKVTKETEQQLTNGAAEQIMASEGELLPPSEIDIGLVANLNSEDAGTLGAVLFETTPLPKKRTIIHPSLDSLSDCGAQLPRWSSVTLELNNASVTPRGILKHISNCSSADFPVHHNDYLDLPNAQKPEHAVPTQRSESVHSLDRKQVRFSPAVSQSEMEGEPQDDKEFREYDLLDRECETFLDEEDDACKLGTGILMNESSINHSITKCKTQQNEEDPNIGAQLPSRQVTEPPTTLSHNSRLVISWEKVDASEALNSGKGTETGAQGVAEPQNIVGQHECHAESHALQLSTTQYSADEIGKPIHAKVQGCRLSSRLTEQSQGPTDEQQGGRIAKVQKWFSWSSNSNRQERRSHQQNIHEAKEESGLLEDVHPNNKSGEAAGFHRPQPIEEESPNPGKEPSREKFKSHESVAEVQTPESGIAAVLNKLKLEAEGKLKSEQVVQDRYSPLSDPIIDEAKLGTKQKEVYNEELPQKLADLKSFWEKGNSGPRILISKTSENSKANETMKDFFDLNEVSNKEVTQCEADPCKSAEELPFRCGETAPVPENVKDAYGMYLLQFKGRKESESPALEVDMKMHPTDSIENKKEVVEQLSPSLLQQEGYSNPGIDPIPTTLHLEENATYFESRKLSEKNNEEVMLCMAKPIFMREEVFDLPVSLKGDTDYQEEEDVIDQDTPGANRQIGSKENGRAGKMRNLKSFWEKEKSGPKIIVGKRKGSSETKLNQNLEPTCNIDKTSATSGSNQRATGAELDNGYYSQSSLVSIKEKVKTGSISQMQNIQNVPDFQGMVHLVKTQFPSTEDAPQHPEKPYSKCQEPTNAVQQINQSPLVETSIDCPPKIPPRRPVKSKTDICSSKSHSADICPPIRELMKKDQKRTSPARLKKGHSSDAMPWDSAVTKLAFDSKGALSLGRLTRGERSRLPQLWKAFEKNPAEEPVASQSISTQKGKESRPQPARRTSLGNLNGRRQGHRRASEGHPSVISEVGDSHHPLARSFIPQGFQHYLGIPEVSNANTRRAPDSERREKGSSAHPPTVSVAELDVVPGPVQASTPRGPREVSKHSSSRGGSEGRVTDDADFDSSRSSTPETWSHYLASSSCYNETQSPVLRVPLKRISSRPMSFSKSLEDITSPSTISSVPAPPSSSFSDPEQMKKLSTSVPAFLQEENDGRDSDSETESSFHTGRQRRTGSASTNFSTSSGMASMSSVSGSVMSIYSGDFGNVEVKGTIQFAINYVQKLGEFHIFVVQCKDLAVADPRKNRSDPYVKSYLLPDKAKLGKRKTTVKKKTLSPTYNEILRYRVDMETLKSQTLNLSVWHNDTFGKNSFLGEVDVDLSRWDFRNTQMNDFTLKPKSTSGLQPTDHRGEIRLALRFLHQSSHSKRTPKTGEVQILVKECKNLPFIRGAIDPFVKCSVLPDTSRKSRQKSRVLKRTSNPVFNHTMVFEGFRPEDLQEACVELTVWDHDRLNNHFLGGVRLGLGTGKSYGAVVDWMDSNSDEAMLWERMMDSHNEWVEDVLPLRMLIMARGMLK